MPRPQRGSSVSNGFLRKDEFSYDPERDAYACPRAVQFSAIRGILRMKVISSAARQRALRTFLHPAILIVL